jgi:hypothetical protein
VALTNVGHVREHGDAGDEAASASAPTSISGYHRLNIVPRLLLDSRVVDVSIAYTPTLVMLSSLKPLFFNSLSNELHFSDNAGA